MELVGHVQNYDWGKLGSSSLVAQLMEANGAIESIDENAPYAELWMGVHPNGQCTLKENGRPISSILDENLTFLFKVLSVRKPLSIQVHPNKEQAKQMHFERPDIYKDCNHKPEMLIALSPFKALCGFRPFPQINLFMTTITPLRQLLINESEEEFSKFYSSAYLRKLFTSLMTAKELDVKNTINIILEDYKKELKLYNVWDVINILNEHYPGDVGVLSLFFLNFVNMEIGDCIYLEPNDVHAYISGDGIECMSCSDNVIRGGLTNKYKDIERLLDCLSYHTENYECKMLRPQNIDAHTVIFAPPISDFSVLNIHLEATYIVPHSLELPPFPGILLVIDGSRMLTLPNGSCFKLKRGSIVYLSPENMANVKFLSLNDCEEEADKFHAYIATPNILVS